MSFFLPSIFQKRILRYALARLELLDTNDLDLEKLDITWGRKSTLELRDIGINIEKVSALLKLPQAFSITKAQISTLRVTIPADLYQSNIVLEADGVHVAVRADSAGEEGAVNTKRKAAKQDLDKRKDVKADNWGKSSPFAHDPVVRPDIDDSGKDEDAQLPTTLDLAQSFMESEPVEERSELQAAVAHSLQTSHSFSSRGDDLDASEVGMGNEVSLPGFLAAYLKGVGDRTKVVIRNFTVDLILGLSDKIELPLIEDIRIRIEIHRVAVGEVSGDFTGKQIRRLEMNHIQLVVISEQSLFSNLAKSTSVSSPETTQASTILTADKNDPGSSSAMAEASSFPDIEDQSKYKIADQRPSQSFSFSTKNSPMLQPGRVDTPADDSPVENATTRTRTSDSSILSDSFYSAKDNSDSDRDVAERLEVSPSSMFGGSDEGPDLKRTNLISKATEKSSKSQGSLPAIWDDISGKDSPNFHSRTGGTQPSFLAQTRGESEMLVENIGDCSWKTSNSPPTRGSPYPEDLSESKIFSHDQRESMYMSVLSGAPAHSVHGETHVPGAWESSHGDEGFSAVVQAGNWEPISTSGFRGKRTKAAASKLSHSLSTENFNDGGPEISAKSLSRDKSARRNRGPTIGSSLRTESPASDDVDLLQQHSESISGGSRESAVLAKRIVSVDCVKLELPCGHGNTEITFGFPDISHRDMPAEALPISQRDRSPRKSPESQRRSEKTYGTTSTTTMGNISQLVPSIAIENIQIISDVALTKLAILMAEKLTAICRPFMIRPTKPASSRPQMYSDFILIVDSISWKFVEVVKAVSVPEDRDLSTTPTHTALHNGADILLSSHIKDLHLHRTQSDGSSRARISIRNFVLGYADADILRFDALAGMKDSLRNSTASFVNDIELEIRDSKDYLSIDVKTLPTHIVLDLRRLDETFSWFGGFSSMLDLGSSMISTVTLLDLNSRGSASRKKPRGVHFDGLAPGPSQQPDASIRSKKVTARIGGICFDLQGSKSGLRMESTAMKIVSRHEALAMQIDRLKLSGTAIENYPDGSPNLVKLANVRMEYLTSPKENDLTRLLTLLAHPKDTHGDEEDILVDTLLRQRKKGSVLRITIESFDLDILDTPALQCIPVLIEEAKKLSTVAKYLPEDDRPGVLILLLVRSFGIEAQINESFGSVSLKAKDMEAANITFPSLSAIGIGNFSVHRNTNEELIGEALKQRTKSQHIKSHSMIMARFVGNEMEPRVKINIHNTRFEYHVAALMSFLDPRAEQAPVASVSDMISSVVDFTSRHVQAQRQSKASSEIFVKSDDSLTGLRALKFDVVFREVILGLNPLNSAAKGLLVLTDAHFTGSMPSEVLVHSTLDVRKAELMIIDDVSRILDPNITHTQKSTDASRAQVQVQVLSEMGYVSISQMSAVKVILQVTRPRPDSGAIIDAEIRDYLFVLESCADSTQSVVALLKGLKPPTPKNTALKYQTEIIPVEDLLASFQGEAAATDGGEEKEQAYSALDDSEGFPFEGDDSSQHLELVGSHYDPSPEDPLSESLTDSIRDEDFDSLPASSIFGDKGDQKRSNGLQEYVQEHVQGTPDPMSLDIQDDYFDLDSAMGDAAHRWDPRKITYGTSKDKPSSCPLRIRMRDVHVIWNLFDGYDWQQTRDSISQAVAEVQIKVTERQLAQKRRSFEPEEEEDDVIGDFLFNSIYIGISAKNDPSELAQQINHHIDDLASETGSFTTSNTGRISPNRTQRVKPNSKQLRLKRSKHHKMTFELKEISADFVVFSPESGNTESSLDIRVQDLEIFDHVSTSTWKKFATYMHDAGEKESGSCMIHIEIHNVKPVPTLAASEITLKASVLPLRLHVDQDTLDFMTRFFSFKEESASDMSSIDGDAPFIQRAEFNSIRIRLDFKPKRVDYAGLRSGRTTEFMNFLVLDSADMVLRHTIIYGVLGFDRLGKTLNDIWMPDIKQNQLPGVLAGLAPIRSLVNVGGGMRDLFVVTVREYKKDGRVVRSFQKGALAFAKTTTSELMRLGTKLAIGTQTVLQTAEGMLNHSSQPQNRLDITADWDDSDMDDNERKQISLYADQPIGVIQGLRGAYKSIERDLLTAKDAVVAMPGEILESGSAGGAARAVFRRAPTIVLRPAMGVSMAVGQTLMGATNSLDPGNRRRVEDKYKKH